MRNLLSPTEKKINQSQKVRKLLTRGRRLLDWSSERDSLDQVRPPLLGDSEQSRVVWLVLIEIVHHDTNEELQAKVHSQEDENVDVNAHELLHAGNDMNAWTKVYTFFSEAYKKDLGLFFRRQACIKQGYNQVCIYYCRGCLISGGVL